MVHIDTADREQQILADLNRWVDGAPWQRAPQYDTSAQIAFLSAPCNPFDCENPTHTPGAPLVPCRHIERVDN